ncbi:MAG: hypothetical protein LBR10_11115 [Prevotellaceae bacterium]|jgi:hypothetical protein|nr:hypothetical protein [Prevotellaceae bacterium]
MKDGQSNYLNMVNAVLKLFSDNLAAWNGIVVVVDGFKQLKETGLSLNDAATKQSDNDPKGHTAAKERSRDALENLLYRTALRVRSYARKIDDDVLAGKTLFSRSELDRLKTNDLLTRGRVVLDVCRDNLPALAAYQVDQKTVDSLSEYIERTAELYAKRDTVIDQRMEATERLARLFSQARKQLKALDDLVEGFVDDDTFVAEYFNARRIHDLKGRKAKPAEE